MSMTLYRLVHFLKEKCVYSVIAITILILITKAFKKKRFQHSNILASHLQYTEKMHTK